MENRRTGRIPKQAKRVFKGKIFEVYQWKQKLFDGGYATFEKLKRPDTVSVIPVMSDGKIMIIEEEQPRKKPFLSVVGGRVNKGEAVRRAAARELLEETGYRAKKLSLWQELCPYDKIRWTIYTFVAKGCVKIGPQKLDGGEKIKPKFVQFGELVRLAAAGKIRSLELANAVLRARAERGGLRRLRELFRP